MIFISHSTEDIAHARSLRIWLRARGCNKVFICSNPTDGIATGEAWRKALKTAGKEAKAVILLISKHWLNSEECWKEYEIADLLGKPILPVRIDKTPIESIRPEIARLHICDISDQSVEDEGYEKLFRSLSIHVKPRWSSRSPSVSRLTASFSIVLVAVAAAVSLSNPNGVKPDYVADLSSLDVQQAKPTECDDSSFADRIYSDSISQRYTCLVSYLCSSDNFNFKEHAESMFCSTHAVRGSQRSFRMLAEEINWERRMIGRFAVSDQVPKFHIGRECNAGNRNTVISRICESIDRLN